MARDITDDIPLNIGNPASLGLWSNSQESYDIAIGGMPFFLAVSNEEPYRRETAPYRKDQFDNANEPGEQSLTGWWIRSQQSFHGGTGIKFYDPAAGEVSAYRFKDSQGVDVFTTGQVTLLKKMNQGHLTTGALTAYGHPNQHLRSIRNGSTNYLLMHDEYDVDKINSAGTETHFIDYNAGTSEAVYAICDDGVNAYWVTNQVVGAANKAHFYKKPLTGDTSTGVSYPAVTGDVSLMFTATGTVVTNAVMEFVKDRIVACINNAVYEMSPTAAALPTATYTNPNVNYRYTSITASGPAIYTAGYSGMYSSIQKYTLVTGTGAMPTLSSAIVAAEFPPGEIVHKIMYYLGYMVIGTSKGVRVALVNDQDGSLTYGPLIVETTQPVFDMCARDRFVWCTTNINGNPGLTRIDLSNEIGSNTLRFAYANDVQVGDVTGKSTTSCAFIGESNQIGFTTDQGYVYVEDSSVLVESGYVTTGAIRYGTLEPKNFKFIRARGSYTSGSMDIQTVDSSGNSYDVITYNSLSSEQEAATLSPTGSQENLSYKFILRRDTTLTYTGPTFKGYQLKALPATKRQRLIQFPVWCYDVETDRYDVKTGYEGRAWERMQTLEDLEAAGDIITYQDFTTGERVQVLIEKVDFIRKSPPSGRFDGFGGILTIIVRTVL